MPKDDIGNESSSWNNIKPVYVESGNRNPFVAPIWAFVIITAIRAFFDILQWLTHYIGNGRF